MRLTQGVRDRLTTPRLHLNIMVVWQQHEEKRLTLQLFISVSHCLIRHTRTTTPGSTPLRWYWSEFWRSTIFIQSLRRLNIEALWPRGRPWPLWSTPMAAKSLSYMCKIETSLMYTRHKHNRKLLICDLCNSSSPATFFSKCDRLPIPWSTLASLWHQTTQPSTKSLRRVFWLPRPINSNQTRNMNWRWVSGSLSKDSNDVI